MIVTQTQQKNDEQLLIATPIVSNRSVPKDLTLESLDRFSLDSPASALTDRSNSSSGGSKQQKLTFRFSCPDEEPIVVPRSRLTNRDKDAQDRERGGLSRSDSPPNFLEGQKRKDRRRRRPFSLVSSITTLITSSKSKSTNCKDKREKSEDRLVVGSTFQLVFARDILSCWARDFAVEILRRMNGNTGAFWFLPSNIYHSFFGIHNSRALVPTTERPLSASEELRIRWNRRRKHRNLSFQKRREQPVSVSGLPNQGQTCFLNSVLQSLASLEPFLDYLEGIVEYQEEKEHLYLSSTLSQQEASKTAHFGGYRRLFFGNRDGTKETPMNRLSSSFSRELLDLLKGINNVEDGLVYEENDKDGVNQDLIRGQRRRRPRRKKLDPKALLHKIAKNNSQFSSYGMYEQQDAQELFASLMDVVIHDSQLDTSSSDHRLEVPSFVARNRSKIGDQAKNPMGEQKFDAWGSGFEIDENDGPMTSAFAHFNNKRKELGVRMSTQHSNREPSPKLLDANEKSMEAGLKNENQFDDPDETNVLSLSDLLIRIGNEQNRLQAESNRYSLESTTEKDSYENGHDYQSCFLEEKKQEHCDASSNTTIDVSSGYNKEKSQQGLLSQGFSSSQCLSLSEKRRMRSTMSAMTPSPLSGWLGSTLQCSKCKHVRPIQNAPFLDIPLVPTSVPNYLSMAYQNSTTKPPSPNCSPLPSCSLQTCLEIFTSVESVDDVECRSCTIEAEIDRLEEEMMMLKGAVETTERRILSKTKGKKANNACIGTREVESLEETKCLREDLLKVQMRLMELKAEDPDQVDDSSPSRDMDDSEDEDFFFGATDPRDKTPIQRCKAKKCLLLTRTPSILCCHIQRRYYDPFNGRMEKCVQFVEFPQFLDLSPYCAYGPLASTPWVAGSLPNERKTQGKQGTIPYQLQSVIEHRGNAFGGHYVSYRRDHTGSWFCISDSRVTPVSWRDVQTCQAYMLFYEAL